MMIFMVEGRAFSKKEIAEKFWKLCYKYNALGGGNGIAPLRKIKVDVLSESEINTEFEKMEDSWKNKKVDIDN